MATVEATRVLLAVVMAAFRAAFRALSGKLRSFSALAIVTKPQQAAFSYFIVTTIN
eukprot:m.100224 g.100224  ORF g.100224 m.100224 type:complete len:56 (+) comp15118_c0_seq5:3350-3517(+)